MRRFVDDAVDDHPEDQDEDEDKAPASWSVAVLDDCESCDDPRVVLTLEPVGASGTGVVAHLAPDNARRLRRALARALADLGEDAG